MRTSNRSIQRVPVQIYLVHQAKISCNRHCHSTTILMQEQDNAFLTRADACELHRCRPPSHWHSAHLLIFPTAAVDRIPAVQLFLDSICWPQGRDHRCYYPAGTRKTCPSLLWCRPTPRCRQADSRTGELEVCGLWRSGRHRGTAASRHSIKQHRDGSAWSGAGANLKNSKPHRHVDTSVSQTGADEIETCDVRRRESGECGKWQWQEPERIDQTL